MKALSNSLSHFSGNGPGTISEGGENMSDDMILKIKCPLCGKSHEYKLLVERDLVFGLRSSTPPPANLSKFTRLFTCPNKDTTFQATITLEETDDSHIESVEVEGLVEERKAGK
jgi:hypothetical protein